VGFVVYQVAHEHFFLQALQFPSQYHSTNLPPLYTICSYLPEGQAGGVWERSKNKSLAAPNIYTEDLEIHKTLQLQAALASETIRIDS
jgi:hypothetical protein